MKKEGWPEFPFSHWQVEKWDMSSLQCIASHLHEKSEAFRNVSGFPGGAGPVEKQIIEHLSCLQQQVLVLTDVLQASLQIIDDQRCSQRLKRVARWVREKAKRFSHRVQESAFYTILALVGTIVTLIGIVIWCFHLIRK